MSIINKIKMIQEFTNLEVWQKEHTSTIHLYKISLMFLSKEKFRLTNLMRRASVSIESNLAEGAGRSISKNFSHFLEIAQVSVFKVKRQVLIARDLNYIDKVRAVFHNLHCFEL